MYPCHVFWALPRWTTRALLDFKTKSDRSKWAKKADLLLLGANPLESVAAYDTIEVVFVAGQPIAREVLSALNAN